MLAFPLNSRNVTMNLAVFINFRDAVSLTTILLPVGVRAFAAAKSSVSPSPRLVNESHDTPLATCKTFEYGIFHADTRAAHPRLWPTGLPQCGQQDSEG